MRRKRTPSGSITVGSGAWLCAALGIYSLSLVRFVSGRQEAHIVRLAAQPGRSDVQDAGTLFFVSGRI